MSSVKLIVLEAVEYYVDPNLVMICQYTHLTFDVARPVVQRLVIDGFLKQKEDAVDHEWNYRLTNAGKAALADKGADHD